MPEMLFIHEYVKGSRTAHVLENINDKTYSVYCFCCGHEAQTAPMPTEAEARSWAEDWVLGQVELAALEEIAQASGGCGCSH